MSDPRQLTTLLWTVTDLLRGAFKPSEYASVLLPLTALRRLESDREDGGVTLAELATKPSTTTRALADYLATFAPDVRTMAETYGFLQQIQRLDDFRLLEQVVARFAEVDLRRATVPDHEMSQVFDDLVRNLVERSTETTGEHSTPLDVVRLAVRLLLAPDVAELADSNAPRTVLDPACGLGGLLDEVHKQVAEINPAIDLGLFGQDVNSTSWAVCCLRMMMEGHDASGIRLGDTLADDRHAGKYFDYVIGVPPFGLSWRGSADAVRQEHEKLGPTGRYGAGLPRLSDGALLFLQHMLSKMKSTGSRVVMMLNESAMRSGRAGTGESEIRRWVIENDLLEGVVALPDGLLHNTAIPTYFWILTNRKLPIRRGKVVLIDAGEQAEQLRRPSGSKRRYFTHERINALVQIYLDPAPAQSDPDHLLHDRVRVVDNHELGHQQVAIEYPPQSPPESLGNMPDASVRVPLGADLDEYLGREILPRVPDARVARDGIKVGYEVSPRLFFRSALDARFVRLNEVVERRPRKRTEVASAERASPPRHLRGSDLQSVDSADELPEVDPAISLFGARCASGDLVKNADGWRVLPGGFGEAVTSLPVLRPRGPFGRALCEWLDFQDRQSPFPRTSWGPPDDLPVPIDLISDELLDEILEDLQKNRRTVRGAVSNLLPNVFAEAKRGAPHFREDVRSVAVQAALAGDVLSSAVDPVWRAEWMYPFHVAALARRYRLGTQPAERKDALLKLGEGVARTVGVLAMSEFVDRGRLLDNVDKLFRSGATFGTWLTVVERFGQRTTPPKMRELAELRNNTRLLDLLRTIKDVRNDSSHAYGVRTAHQLEEEVEVLEPLVLSALTAANWLPTVSWDWVQRCEYLDEHSYLLIGQRLRGGHPDWEPFQRSSTHSLKPGRLYAGTDSTAKAGQPVDLTPLATVRICVDCHARELFLISRIKGDEITLRSLEEHSANDVLRPVSSPGEPPGVGAG